jgi:hypothetical protein
VVCEDTNQGENFELEVNKWKEIEKYLGTIQSVEFFNYVYEDKYVDFRKGDPRKQLHYKIICTKGKANISLAYQLENNSYKLLYAIIFSDYMPQHPHYEKLANQTFQFIDKNSTNKIIDVLLKNIMNGKQNKEMQSKWEEKLKHKYGVLYEKEMLLRYQWDNKPFPVLGQYFLGDILQEEFKTPYFNQNPNNPILLIELEFWEDTNFDNKNKYFCGTYHFLFEINAKTQEYKLLNIIDYEYQVVPSIFEESVNPYNRVYHHYLTILEEHNQFYPDRFKNNGIPNLGIPPPYRKTDYNKEVMGFDTKPFNEAESDSAYKEYLEYQKKSKE